MSGETLVDVFWERVETNPERPAVLHKVDGAYRPVIWREQGKVVELLAGGLLKLGIKSGDKVAIMANTRAQWTWADMAILSCAGVSIPIYPTLSYIEVEYLLRHSDSVGVFVENDLQLNKILSIKDLPPQFSFIILMEGEPPVVNSNLRIIKWEDLLKDGEVYLLANKNVLTDRIKEVKPESLASIVYTSGTTGQPKGAMLLHRNIYAVCEAISHLVGFHADDIALSFLPLSHVYERVGGQFVSIYVGLVVAYAESIETVAQNMMEVRPTIMNGVPRFFEKIYNRMQYEIRKLSKPQQYLIRWALALGRRAVKQKEIATGVRREIVNNIYKAELRVAERLVFSRIRRRFGGRIRFMVSGAAPLSSEVQVFFATIGIDIIEGYGLTETAAPATCNTPNGIKRGTVGRPLPGVQVKLAEDGELMVKGPNVFAGYYKNDPATKEVLQNGWFMTGDIAEIDADGYVKIKDRKKDIIITANGKHVAPQFLENLFAGESLIGHILVYGDRRKYITALITLNTEGLAAFAKEKQISYGSFEELIYHPLVLQELEEVVKKKNQRLANFEQIKRYAILDKDFSIADNELTPTLKVKRRVVTEKYHELLDSLYDTQDLEVEQ